MLSFAEEIYLLALDDLSGEITIPSKEIVLHSALIGAALCELSFQNRIDTDHEYLYVVNDEAVGNPLLDEILDELKKNTGEKATLYSSLKSLLPRAKDIEKKILKLLLDKGILKKEESKVLWFFPTRRYPSIDSKEIKDVETRLRELVTSDAIPEPREAVLVSLVYACGLFEEILSPREFRRNEDRIKQLAKMDLVGQKVQELIDQINAFRSLAMGGI